MGEQFNFGRLAWDISEAEMDTPLEEIHRFLGEPDNELEIRFTPAPESRVVLRKVFEKVWAEFQSSFGSDAVSQPGVAAVGWSRSQ